MKHKKRR